MRVALIVAVAENGVIGREGGLPWRLSADLRRFKRLTMGRALIMGRRTYESIGRPLPGRRLIVVTRQPNFCVAGGEAVGSLDEAYLRAEAHDDAEALVIGGTEIFAQALPRAERLYLTRVQASPPGDVHFPAFDSGEWRLVSSESHPADAQNEHPFAFELYERVH